MKRFIIPLSLAVMTLASCSIEEENAPVPSQGTHLVFSGETCASTKVSIGEKDGETYPLLWYTGDVISINSKDPFVEGAFVGEMADLYAESSGSVSGIFQTVNEIEPKVDMDLYILYPGGSMSYSNGIISGSVPATQTQRSTGSSVHIGNGCFSFAKTSISAGQSEGVSFALDQKTAFVKVIVEMEDYADYYLESVTLSADGYELSGDIEYDPETDEMTVSNASSSVGATISNTSLLSEDETVYFTALPCDLTDQSVYVIVTMSGDSGETLTFPIEINGGKLAAGCLSVIELNGSSLLNWYDPVETRDLMDGYAYGKQNTYFIEQDETGVTKLNIDVRARGDFLSVKAPKYYSLLTGSSETEGMNLLYLPDGTNAQQETPTNVVNDDCSIDVYCYSQADGAGHWGTVAIYDEDYDLLWSFMIWKYLSGDEPGDIVYSDDITMMDRVMGYPYSNKLALEKGTFDPGSGALFQWGRKDPFPWGELNNYEAVESESDTDIIAGIKHPTWIYALSSENNWVKVDMDAELWGGVNEGSSRAESGVGHKTIYDPCPAGYRVCDSKVFTNMDRWEVDNGLDIQDTNASQYINSDSPFYEKGESVFVCETQDGSYDYWPFGGCNYASSPGTYKNRPANAYNRGVTYWSCNISDSNKTGKSYCKEVIYFSSSISTSDAAWKHRASLVRCQKDDENR